MKSTSTSNSIDASPADNTLINLSPMGATTKSFVGLANLASVHPDMTESTRAVPTVSDSDKTLPTPSECHKGNVDDPCAVIDTGAKATAVNLQNLLHKPLFFPKKNPGQVKMCRATVKDILTTLIERGFLRNPANTPPAWIKIKCHHSLHSNATLLNEQEIC